MKKYTKTVLLLFILIMSACESYDFDQEQYRNEVNLLSNTSMIYDRQVAEMQGNSDTIYLIAGLSGTNPFTSPIRVAITEADSLLQAYNKSNFDIDESRFAKLLPEECYSVPELDKQIPVGEFQVKFPVHLTNLDRLSPDTTYFLNYKIDPMKTHLYNKNKQEVLLRIYMKNDYATTQTNTFYNYTSSFISVSGGVPSRPTSSNQLFPLSDQSVRMLAGDETFGDYTTALDHINRKSIRVNIGEQTPQNPEARFVTIEPYKSIDVVQMPPIDIYDNTYLINIISTPDGRHTYYKEFRMHYKYRLSADVPYREVKAILRMEFNPRADLL